VLSADLNYIKRIDRVNGCGHVSSCIALCRII